MPVARLTPVWPGTEVRLAHPLVNVGHIVFPADYLSHSRPARGMYAKHYVQDYHPTIPLWRLHQRTKAGGFESKELSVARTTTPLNLPETS